MEENKKRSDNDQLVALNILNLGTIRLAKRYCFKENLQYLSQISKLIVTTDQGEEILPDSEDFFSQFNSNSVYFLVDAADLELVSDDEDSKVKQQKHGTFRTYIKIKLNILLEYSNEYLPWSLQGKRLSINFMFQNILIYFN